MVRSRFANDTTVFLHVDLTRYSELAKELKINMEGYAGEIPIFIAFQKVAVFVDFHRRGKRSVVSPSLVRSREEGAVDGLRWNSILDVDN